MVCFFNIQYMKSIDKVKTVRLGCSELITACSQNKCCDFFCMVGLVGMPLDK